MAALSELFDETRLLVPVKPQAQRNGEIPLRGHQIHLVPLSPRRGLGLFAKLSFLPWLLRNGPVIFRELLACDAIHAPIPGDVGTMGMIGAFLLRKPLFVRHCGNWLKPVTTAEKFWCWFMERFAGGRNIMLATGGTPEPPSCKNPNVRWIFSSSLTEEELHSCALPRSLQSHSLVRLVHVARQEMAKGAGTIIRSLPLLSTRFPGVSLDILGCGSAIPEFQRLAADLGVTDRVHFAGKLNHEQVMQQLQKGTLFVFPTTSSDGFPKAVLEGLATGLPVIATRVSVLPHLLDNGCGVLIDEATPEAIARGIETALADPERYAKMSQKAIETAQRHSLESWRDTISKRLATAWGPLKSVSPQPRAGHSHIAPIRNP